MKRTPSNSISKFEKSSNELSKFWSQKLSDWVFTEIPRWHEEKREEKACLTSHRTAISKEWVEKLLMLSSNLEIPLKSILLTAHCKVVSVISGNTDIITGYDFDNNRANSGNATGCFQNTLPVRIKCAEEGSWRSLISKVNVYLKEALPFSKYPISQVKGYEEISSKMYDTIFKFYQQHNLNDCEELNNKNIEVSQTQSEDCFAFISNFLYNSNSSKLSLNINYDSNEFCTKQIASISQYYINTLELIITDSEAIHQKQSILPLEEQNVLLEKFNDTKVEYPSDKTFVELFENQVNKTPNAIALKFNDTEWSYRQLNEYSNKLANYLIESNLKIEDAVVVVMDRTNFWTVAMLGILKAGGVYVPVDPEWPEVRKTTITNKTRAKFVIGDAKNENNLVQVINKNDDEIQLITLDTHLAELSDLQNPINRTFKDNLSYIIFTSGSTGEPKGAMIEHKGMLNHLYSKVNDLNLTAKDIVAQNSSQCFDISVWQLISGFIVGAKTIIYSNELILDILQFLHHIKQERVTILELVPSYMKILLKLSNRNRTYFDNLKFLLVTGEPLKIGLVTSWFNFFKKIPLVNAYGPTEASDDITHHFMHETPKDGIVPVGKPIQNLNIYVVDKFSQLAPIGTKGEVYVSGVGVGRGYIGDMEKTETVFSTDNFKPHKKLKLYKTGDIGSWTPNGVLHLFGREDTQIKLNGYRIDLGEIEQCLSKQNGVTDNAVLLKEKQLHAFLAFDDKIKEGQNLLEQCKSELHKNLPHYMVPRKFHVLESLPLTPNGKIDRRALQKIE